MDLLGSLLCCICSPKLLPVATWQMDGATCPPAYPGCCHAFPLLLHHVEVLRGLWEGSLSVCLLNKNVKVVDISFHLSMNPSHWAMKRVDDRYPWNNKSRQTSIVLKFHKSYSVCRDESRQWKAVCDFYNKLKSASERTSKRAIVLRDGSRQLRASVLLLITTGSQSEPGGSW